MIETSRLFFEHLASEWDARQPADRQEKLDQLITLFHAQVRSAQTILDVGTGTGGLVPVLKKHNPQAGIIQVDFANAMLTCAQLNRNGDQHVQADVHQLPFLSEAFDLVICHNSFPHFHQKSMAVKSIRRVLKPGGYFLILHELSRARVNAIHQNAAAVEIHQDLLLENNDMFQLLTDGRFPEIQINEDPLHYSVSAKK